MPPTEIAFLAALVNLAHGSALFHRTVEVQQVHSGVTLWTGAVAVFQLQGHPRATECYAWLAQESPMTHPIIFLKSANIDSPAAAVRAHVRQLCVELAA